MFAEVPFTAAMAAVVREEWSVAGEAVRLPGGEESAAYRVADYVVRIGPRQRSLEQIEWCHAIAVEAALEVPEIVAPVRASSGATVVRADDHPISVWPLAEGRWLDRESASERQLAAAMLAKLHVAMKDLTPPPRPTPSFLDLDRHHPRLEDPVLDRWLKDFERPEQLLHGDYYRGNLLVAGNKITAVIDWDEAWVGAPEIELAGAAREFGAHWDTDLTEAKLFIDDYFAEGGTAQPMDDETLVQLIRHRLRAELTEFAPAELPADDDYHQRQLDLFERLRP
jgi:Ser/Thr protein kinase RdoA (MazF antagonist)